MLLLPLPGPFKGPRDLELAGDPGVGCGRSRGQPLLLLLVVRVHCLTGGRGHQVAVPLLPVPFTSVVRRHVVCVEVGGIISLFYNSSCYCCFY
jgi:hypothetical protein